MKRILTGLFLTIISLTGFSQGTQTGQTRAGSAPQPEAIAREQITRLHDGALLVRLHTKNKSITALRNIGKTKEADEVEKKQAEYNLNIVSAFKLNFSFCPVYFFYSDYSTNIIEKQFDQVVFLNDSLRADPNINFDFKSFLTADFGIIEQDTARYFDYKSLEMDTTGAATLTNNYYGGADMSFGALIIRSDKLMQLRDPFPYYVRTFDSLPTARNLGKVVKKMNTKLNDFYRQANK